MRPFAFVPVACIALTLTACSSLVGPKLSAAPYDQVRFSMPKEDVVALLGAPQQDGGVVSSWESRVDEGNFSQLHVRFNKNGQVAWMKRTSKSTKTTVSSAPDLQPEQSAARLNQSYLDTLNGRDIDAVRKVP